MKKWLMFLGLFVILLGAVLAVGCGKSEVSSIPLTITEPQDETMVYSADLVVRGQTEPDAVVSVNDAVVDVAVDGKFSTTLTLEEGPNLIVVLASDFEGNEASASITVIYVKQ